MSKALPLRRQIDEAVALLRDRGVGIPRVGIILGTGLGVLAERIEPEVVVPYCEIPHFPISTVEGHAGELLFGHLAGVAVVVLKGRVHFYEGYSMQQVAFPVRVIRGLGARELIISSAVGGLNPLFRPGEIVLVTDHINLMGDNPLIGSNDETLGPRFPDMSEPYCREHLKLTERLAVDEKIPMRKGVFVGVAGPNLETAAEYRFLRQIGADVVGMSLIPENLAAVHGGLRTLAFAIITDSCLPDALEPVDIQKILRTAAEAEPKLSRLVERVVEELPEE
ncbi:MAG: purine-nucleoside phosphorylase [Candidatus Eisenbacteria bacterium]|uniref:Purine nucleoside phosphorylase n=1 Tax=Eiseniibacteriota bacterium TaxID=2212470 RepID=A0A948W840_UNCEI|nr:purine-nucleoside phosphorylase [Candidatus Eisenbacteria bacterium]MBU1948428.1 purine-nucleoside phosphorylase [Candidatus Eisenbacteria bacterium]MBU2692905.1 purine-nucleoside phosphorylase [Candidatus Eisenbacteria bacterium]